MAVLVVINPDSSRDDLVTCLTEFNTQAKNEARRGYAGLLGQHYKDCHDTINALVTAIETVSVLGELERQI